MALGELRRWNRPRQKSSTVILDFEKIFDSLIQTVKTNTAWDVDVLRCTVQPRFWAIPHQSLMYPPVCGDGVSNGATLFVHLLHLEVVIGEVAEFLHQA